VMLLPSLWFSFRDTPVSIKLFFQTISIPACFGLVMAVVLMILSYGIAFWPSCCHFLLGTMDGLSDRSKTCG
jgi:hypothetical protein